MFGYSLKKNRQTTSQSVSHLLALLITLNCVHAPKPANQDSKIKVTKETEIISSHFGLDDIELDSPDVIGNTGTKYRPLAPFPHFPGIGGGGSTIGGGGGGDSSSTAFSVARAHPVSRICYREACIVLFENLLTIPGRTYDKKSGFFICAIPGLYFFTFSAISPAYSSFRLALVKNEHEVVSAYGSANGFDMAGNGIVLPLQAGDKVCLKLLEGEIYESHFPFRAYTSFSGFLIQSYNYPYPDYHHHYGGHPYHGAKGVGGAYIPDREPLGQGGDGTPGILEAGPRSLPTKQLTNDSTSDSN